jgi:hypothetical protein
MTATAKQAAKAGRTISQTAESAQRSTKKAIKKQRKGVIKQISRSRVRRTRLIDVTAFVSLFGLILGVPRIRRFFVGQLQRMGQTIDLTSDATQPSATDRISSVYPPGDGAPATAEHGAAYGRS